MVFPPCHHERETDDAAASGERWVWIALFLIGLVAL